jgi:hypothetical protein
MSSRQIPSQPQSGRACEDQQRPTLCFPPGCFSPGWIAREIRRHWWGPRAGVSIHDRRSSPPTRDHFWSVQERFPKANDRTGRPNGVSRLNPV